jgi:hypothetical protein
MMSWGMVITNLLVAKLKIASLFMFNGYLKMLIPQFNHILQRWILGYYSDLTAMGGCVISRSTRF